MTTKLFQIPNVEIKFKPNLWDAVAFILVFGILAIIAWVGSQITTPYDIGNPPEISLQLSALPGYAAHTVLRMFIALFFSLLFTLLIAPLMAKNRQAEKLLLPTLDILQSVPILGILSITVVGFIQLFPNSRLGPECAALFAIFTSQVWNMTFSLYQSLKTIPEEYYDTALLFHLSTWKRFWRIDLPHAMPSLIWNMMISLSGGWFFVVASEAISVANQNIMLPGIGSYISLAIAKANFSAILFAILTMLMVILLYDQLIFRPLLTWAERFKSTMTEDTTEMRSWFLTLLSKAQLFNKSKPLFSYLLDAFLNLANLTIIFKKKPIATSINKLNKPYYRWLLILWDVFWMVFVVSLLLFLWAFVSKGVDLSEILTVFYLGSITLLKVVILILLASLLWVPIGVWIGLHPRVSQGLQPVIQFLAAFPANLIYPVLVTFIVYYQLNVNIWSTPLMILGTQWYILFNVIAGTRAIPKELRLASHNFGVNGRLWWQRLILPAIFPYYITGAMTAAAGCWNASIVADVLEWGNHQLVATGLGSYIAHSTRLGDFPRIALGISVMCIYVTLINRFIWRRLYQVSTRFTFHS